MGGGIRERDGWGFFNHTSLKLEMQLWYMDIVQSAARLCVKVCKCVPLPMTCVCADNATRATIALWGTTFPLWKDGAKALRGRRIVALAVTERENKLYSKATSLLDSFSTLLNRKRFQDLNWGGLVSGAFVKKVKWETNTVQPHFYSIFFISKHMLLHLSLLLFSLLWLVRWQ